MCRYQVSSAPTPQGFGPVLLTVYQAQQSIFRFRFKLNYFYGPLELQIIEFIFNKLHNLGFSWGCFCGWSLCRQKFEIINGKEKAGSMFYADHHTPGGQIIFAEAKLILPY